MPQDNSLKKLLRVIYVIEDGIVALILSSILLLSVYQIILRNFFNEGIIWGDGLIKILVLWLGMSGAMIATRQGKQIRINIFGKLFGPTIRAYLGKINLLFAFVACLIVAYYSLQFTITEYSYASNVLGFIPSWIATVIIPVSFLIMAARYLIKSLMNNRPDGPKK